MDTQTKPGSVGLGSEMGLTVRASRTHWASKSWAELLILWAEFGLKWADFKFCWRWAELISTNCELNKMGRCCYCYSRGLRSSIELNEEGEGQLRLSRERRTPASVFKAN